LLLAIGLVAELLVAGRRQEVRNYAIAARTSSPAALGPAAEGREMGDKG